MGQRRKFLYKLLEIADHGDRSSFFVDIFLQILILLNVIAILAGSIEGIRPELHDELHIFEIVSVIIFTIEYLLRVWSCVESRKYKHPVKGRIKFMLTPIALIDLLAILPFYLIFVDSDLRMLRMVRMLKILRYSHGFKSIGRAFYSKREELITTLFIFMVFVIFISYAMYWAEKEAQPEIFSSIPAAMWWGVITLTTVGYGDVVPVTLIGKVIGAISALIGIAMYALPSGIIVSGFLEEFQKRKLKREAYKESLAKLKQSQR